MTDHIDHRTRVGRLAAARLQRLIRNTPRFSDAVFYGILGRINRDLQQVGL